MPEHYRYLGDGTEFYNGVPGRDLTTEEFDALGEREQLLVREGGLYRRESIALTLADDEGFAHGAMLPDDDDGAGGATLPDTEPPRRGSATRKEAE